MKILYINKNIELSKPIVNQMIKMGFEVDILIESLPKALNKSAFSHKIGNVFSRLILKFSTASRVERTKERSLTGLIGIRFT